ncbi:MAG: hypothetical protein FD174_2598 [Geobacteraceae bacterium]|nr:MAG: hypothetical protein FD174_2598 [Geobacteraceae bacterium]
MTCPKCGSLRMVDDSSEFIKAVKCQICGFWEGTPTVQPTRPFNKIKSTNKGIEAMAAVRQNKLAAKRQKLLEELEMVENKLSVTGGV